MSEHGAYWADRLREVEGERDEARKFAGLQQQNRAFADDKRIAAENRVEELRTTNGAQAWAIQQATKDRDTALNRERTLREVVEQIGYITQCNFEHSGEMALAVDKIQDLACSVLESTEGER